jgi:NAD(P)-dependent dehydrogenase (short-subunit alcohol dehydrogenase family)
MASPYAVAKAGVEQLGRALRLELSVHGASATVAYFGFVDTRMVQEAVDQRLRAGLPEKEPLPGFIRRRISPRQAGEAVARAIEQRRARVIAPSYWTAISVLRGVLNPVIDYAAARATRVQDVIREADRSESSSSREGDRSASSSNREGDRSASSSSGSSS